MQESGLDLADYKGKTVEKWTVLCPQLSTGDHDTYCVLLVYKAKAVGAIFTAKAVRRGDRAYHCRQSRRRRRLERRKPWKLSGHDAYPGGSETLWTLRGRALLVRAHAVGADSISAREALRQLPFIHPTTVPAAAQTPNPPGFPHPLRGHTRGGDDFVGVMAGVGLSPRHRL